MGTMSKSKLKEAFNALCVPNQGDFELLINFCDEGNQILSASQAGLIIKDNRLAVNPNQDVGLGFDHNALVLKLKTALCAADSAVRVLLSTHSGLRFKQQGIAINNGDGLELLSNVLKLKLTQKSGLASDTLGLRVALDGNQSGLEITQDGGLRIKHSKLFQIKEGALTLNPATCGTL